MDQAAAGSFIQSAELCQWAEPEHPSLAVSWSLGVCVTSTMENNTLFKRTRCICKFKKKKPTKPPMNTEPQTSYCVLSNSFFWLKSQMQAVTVRAEPRRAGTLITRYSSPTHSFGWKII